MFEFQLRVAHRCTAFELCGNESNLSVGLLGSLVLASELLGSIDLSDSKRESIRLTYLGNAGYEIDNATTILLVDTYLTQFKSGGVGPTDLNDKSDPILKPDTGEINKQFSVPDYILITHSHSDHLLDAPNIAVKTKTVILGTDGTARICAFARRTGRSNDRGQRRRGLRIR
jgi:hypothetical protein